MKKWYPPANALKKTCWFHANILRQFLHFDFFSIFIIQILFIMKLKNLLFIVTAIFLFFGCGPQITSTLYQPKQALSDNQKVALLDTHHIIPENSIKTGQLKFGDNGFSTGCSFKKNCLSAIAHARKIGSNVIKITNHKKPDLLSSCHRMVFELYYYEGDVQSLPQLTL